MECFISLEIQIITFSTFSLILRFCMKILINPVAENYCCSVHPLKSVEYMLQGSVDHSCSFSLDTYAKT